MSSLTCQCQQSYRNFAPQEVIARNEGNNKERRREISGGDSPLTGDDDATNQGLPRTGGISHILLTAPSMSGAVRLSSMI